MSGYCCLHGGLGWGWRAGPGGEAAAGVREPPFGRRKKLRFHPRQLYLSVKQGELQKVVLMLCEYVLIHSHESQRPAGQWCGEAFVLTEVPAGRTTAPGEGPLRLGLSWCPGSLL